MKKVPIVKGDRVIRREKIKKLNDKIRSVNPESFRFNDNKISAKIGYSERWEPKISIDKGGFLNYPKSIAYGYIYLDGAVNKITISDYSYIDDVQEFLSWFSSKAGVKFEIAVTEYTKNIPGLKNIKRDWCQ